MGHDPLETYLRDNLDEAQAHSSGRFSLDPARALEKLSAYQLPRLQAWILKLIQAAVAQEALGLSVSLGSDSTLIKIATAAWELDVVEGALCDPAAPASPALFHLLQALWSAGFGQGRPFQIEFPNQTQALSWDGHRLMRIPTERGSALRIRVSLLSTKQRQKNWLWRRSERSRRNAELLQEVTGHAFSCPIPLWLDGRRIDDLQICPSHGLSRDKYPIQLGFIRNHLAPFGVPQATYHECSGAGSSNRWLARCLFQVDSPAPEASVGYLLTAHFPGHYVDKRWSWTPQPLSSVIYWLRDGVTVGSHLLPIEMPISCAIFAQAYAVGLDGLSCQPTPPQIGEVLRSLDPVLDKVGFTLESARNRERLTSRWLGLALMAGGGFLFWLGPMTLVGALGFSNIVGGAWVTKVAPSEAVDQVDALLRYELNLFVKSFSQGVTPM